MTAITASATATKPAKAKQPKAQGEAVRITWAALVRGVAEGFGDRDFTRKELMTAIQPLAERYYAKNANYQQSVASQLTAGIKAGWLVRTARGVYRLA